MTEAKFTKGPWTEYLVASNIVEVHNSDGLEVVNWQGFDGNGNFSNQTVEANALLIAAAPEMYEMLAEIMHNLECGNSDHIEINDALIPRVQDLLAKARGE